jgi:predicted CopG family antitoxin
MSHATASKLKRKLPRTFSLSQDVIEVLEHYKKERKAESLTAAVEEIVREWKKANLSAQVTAYYDSLSDEESKHEKQWGKFSESQM